MERKVGTKKCGLKDYQPDDKKAWVQKTQGVTLILTIAMLLYYPVSTQLQTAIQFLFLSDDRVCPSMCI